MLCDKCKKNVATVSIKQLINGHYSEKHLCAECAKLDEADMLGPMDFLTSFSAPARKKANVCKNCGMSESDFVSSGYLGCTECYKAFPVSVNNMIAHVQHGMRHTGRRPGKFVGQLTERQRLEAELQQAVKEEKYLKAAEIRAKLDNIINGGDGNEQ